MADLKNNMFRTDIVIGVNVGNKTQMEPIQGFNQNLWTVKILYV